MAEINVTKKSPSAWPWVLVAIAIVALVWVWIEAMDPDSGWRFAGRQPVDAVGVAPATGPGAPPAEPGVVAADRTDMAADTSPAVQEYLEFAGLTDGAADRTTMGREHEYTVEGLRKLSAALNAVVERQRDDDARAAFERFRQTADQIQQDATSSQHANAVREAFMRAAEVLTSLDNVPSANDVRSVAESIKPDQPLLEQRETVQEFFRTSARAIQTAAAG